MTPEIKVGSRVQRKKVNAFRYMSDEIGTVVELIPIGRVKIKWDNKASTGQQHSTIQLKFLTITTQP